MTSRSPEVSYSSRSRLHHQQQQHQHLKQQQQQQGPRVKCDQVVFEAIAKAAEIIVRGRCARLSSSFSSVPSPYYPHYQPGTTNTTTHQHYQLSPSSGRFNIEVEEVQVVRYVAILHSFLFFQLTITMHDRKKNTFPPFEATNFYFKIKNLHIP